MTVKIDREGIHRRLDVWLNSIEADPLSWDNGEQHYFKVEAAIASDEDVDMLVTAGDTRRL